jgi:hypothetical protein
LLNGLYGGVAINVNRKITKKLDQVCKMVEIEQVDYEHKAGN